MENFGILPRARSPTAAHTRSDEEEEIGDDLPVRWITDYGDQTVILIDAVILREAERLIESCEACNEEGAQIPFDNILDRVTGSDPSVTDYILEKPAKCPNCRREVLEKTLIEPA